MATEISPIDLAEYREGDPEALIAYAVGVIRGHCGWHITPVRQDTVTLRPPWQTGIVMLPTLQLVSVDALTVDDTIVDPSTVVAHDAGYFDRPTVWPCKSPAKAVVEFTHGYAEWPVELKALVLAIASRAEESPAGKTQEVTGPFSESFAQVAPGVSGGVVLMEHEKAIANRYRLPPLG